MKGDKPDGSTKPVSPVSLFRGVYDRVAKRLGVDPSYVSRVARGERKSAAVEQALADEVRAIRDHLNQDGRLGGHDGVSHDGAGHGHDGTSKHDRVFSDGALHDGAAKHHDGALQDGKSKYHDGAMKHDGALKNVDGHGPTTRGKKARGKSKADSPKP
jgi:hypothetical protein